MNRNKALFLSIILLSAAESVQATSSQCMNEWIAQHQSLLNRYSITVERDWYFLGVRSIKFISRGIELSKRIGYDVTGKPVYQPVSPVGSEIDTINNFSCKCNSNLFGHVYPYSIQLECSTVF